MNAHSEQPVIKYATPPKLDEQETIITYDKGLKEWHLFTDNPVHARKYEHLTETDDNFLCTKTYHAKTGELIGLEGKITGSVSIGKKRTFTDEQRQAMSERMKNAVSESTSD